MQNFQNQVKQLVGSIQMSNDLDVHIALVQAPSYAKEYMEKYSSTDKTPYQICREFVDLFGIVQKNPNALDILIEEANPAQPVLYLSCFLPWAKCATRYDWALIHSRSAARAGTMGCVWTGAGSTSS